MITGAIISLTDLGHATSYKAMNCLKNYTHINGFGQEAQRGFFKGEVTKLVPHKEWI